MGRPQGYAEGGVFETGRVKSKRSKVTAEKLALLALCLLLASALVVAYLLTELMKTRETIRKLVVQLETVESDVTERLPDQPCPTVQPTCPPQPEVKMNTKPMSTERPTSPQPPEVTNDPCSGCEDDWKEHGEKCYYFNTRKFSWNESRAECGAKGGDLAKIESLEERSFLRKTVQQKMLNDLDLFWVGLTDSAAEGSWVWMDGSPVNQSLTFWSLVEPDDWPGVDPDGEDCAGMVSSAMSDRSCKALQKSICVKPAESVCVSDVPTSGVPTSGVPKTRSTTLS